MRPSWIDAVRTDGVPALPDRRRAGRDLVQPGRDLASEQHQVRRVELARGRQRREDEGRAEEAGGDPTVGLADQVRERLADRGSLGVRGDAEFERDGAAGLGGHGVLGPRRPRRRRHLRREPLVRLGDGGQAELAAAFAVSRALWTRKALAM